MTSLKVKVSERVLDKILKFLSQFDRNDLEILKTDDQFEKDKQYVHAQLKRLESEEANTYSFEEFDNLMEKVIKKYED